jgi:hypothetical protein
MTTPTVTLHPCRLRRLSYGWDADQLAARMKLQAERDGINLPRAYILARWLFLWENHRAPLPPAVVGLLVRVLDTPPVGVRSTARA